MPNSAWACSCATRRLPVTLRMPVTSVNVDDLVACRDLADSLGLPFNIVSTLHRARTAISTLTYRLDPLTKAEIDHRLLAGRLAAWVPDRCNPDRPLSPALAAKAGLPLRPTAGDLIGWLQSAYRHDPGGMGRVEADGRWGQPRMSAIAAPVRPPALLPPGPRRHRGWKPGYERDPHFKQWAPARPPMRSLTLDVLVDRYAAVSDADRRRLDALAGLLDQFAS
ncbi:MAG: hypothetical protein U0361_05845 [Nitrospiraceae bacterium]